MPFASLKGQDSAVSFLRASLRHDRLSHAYIFFGPNGVGKRSAALNFAKILNCASPVASEPCENCNSCKKINALVHPDLFILKPEEEGDSIKIDDIRKLIKNIYLKPFEAKKKIYIIDGAESMKHEAANALLKTLEEPPADSILILITENLKSLFHTIVSRAQTVRFFPLKLKEMEEILKNEYSLDSLKAHILSHLSGGRLGEALKFKDEDIFSKRPPAKVNFDDIPKDKVRLYLYILLTWFRDILNTKAGVDNSMLVNIDKEDIIAKESKKLSFEYLDDVISGIMQTLSYLDQNANQKLAMSVLNLKIERAQYV